jgi:hypothetical protein
MELTGITAGERSQSLVPGRSESLPCGPPPGSGADHCRSAGHRDWRRQEVGADVLVNIQKEDPLRLCGLPPEEGG